MTSLALAAALLADLRLGLGGRGGPYRVLAAADVAVCRDALGRWEAQGGTAKPSAEFLDACRALPKIQEAAAAHERFLRQLPDDEACSRHFTTLGEVLRGSVAATDLDVALASGLARCRGATPAEPRRAAPSPEGAILPDARFTRRRVLVQFDGRQMDEAAFGAVLQGLEPETEVVVLASDREAARAAVGRAGLENPSRVRVEYGGDGLAPWSRDYFIARATRKGPGGEVRGVELVRPRQIPAWTPEGGGERPPVQRALEEHDRDFYRFRVSEINFEGGMIVNDGRAVFVSKQIQRLNPSLSPADLETALRRELGLERLLLIDPLPGWAHIDLYVTPLGGGEVLVADAAAGARLVSDWLGSEPPAANPRLATLAGLCRRRKAAPRAVFKAGAYRLPDVERFAAPLDAIAARLGAEGYLVRRIPSLLGSFPSAFTYNNVFQTGSRALIPSFGIAPLDRAAAAAYARLGLDPKAVPAATLACTGGVLHCSVHEIGVGDPPHIAGSAPPEAH